MMKTRKPLTLCLILALVLSILPASVLAVDQFADVKDTDYFYVPVLWAAEQGITTGVSDTSFAPEEECTRAQIVTFLWRYNGMPEPKTEKNPFTDVKKADYLYKAVLWAVEQGITTGTSKTTFSPEDTCTRAQAATFLYRSHGNFENIELSSPFVDIKKGEYYYNPVLWAVKNEITNGTSNTTFSPEDNCTRAQIVTFLYRYYCNSGDVGTLTINTKKDTTVYIGETLQIDYTYTGDKSKLNFKSSKESVLTVNNSGLVTGVGHGMSWIDIYHGNIELGSVRLYVTARPSGPKAESIGSSEFTGPYFNGTYGVVGNYMTFSAWARTSGDNQKVTVTSSNTNVATVTIYRDWGGVRMGFKVSFVGAGSTTITITSDDKNVSTSYNLNVKSNYACNPGGGLLSPEEFAYYATAVMVENGATATTGSGYRVLTLTDSDLTWYNARACAEAWVREFWPNGITAMGLAYQGMNEDGKHVFYIHR